jgi:hypothetical protein
VTNLHKQNTHCAYCIYSPSAGRLFWNSRWVVTVTVINTTWSLCRRTGTHAASARRSSPARSGGTRLPRSQQHKEKISLDLESPELPGGDQSTAPLHGRRAGMRAGQASALQTKLKSQTMSSDRTGPSSFHGAPRRS